MTSKNSPLAASGPQPSGVILGFVVLVGGISTMATEMLASRLIAPFYGTSLLVWTVLLSAILIALTLGYRRGGRLADADPRSEPLAQRLLIASVLLSLAPFVCRTALLSFSDISIIPLRILGPVLPILYVCLPVTLLAEVSPSIIRIQARSTETMGAGSGLILALSTLGSIAGTYLPALVGIPYLGTFGSFLALGMLVGLGAAVLIRTRRVVAIGVVLPALLFVVRPITMRPGAAYIYEGETVYNTIRVAAQDAKNPDGKTYTRNLLILNEGFAVHSVSAERHAYHFPLVGSVWDYMGQLPVMCQPPGPTLDVAIVGLAGGTVATELVELYGKTRLFDKVRIKGAEIDPLILKVAKDYFRLNYPEEVEAKAEDGRTFLRRNKGPFDIIVTDAYRQPYIPFHLTTQEYFSLVRDRLKPRGICSINVGSTGKDELIIQQILATMGSVFPEVFILEIPRVSPLFANYLVLASREKGVIHRPSDPSNTLGPRLLAAWPSIGWHLRNIMTVWEAGLSPAVSLDSNLVLTDDKAPVEHLVHKMIVKAIFDPQLTLPSGE